MSELHNNYNHRYIYPFTIFTILYMTALTKRIPVSEPVWSELSELRRAGQTYNDILTEMIELKKKQRLADDIQRSLNEGDFLLLSEIKIRKNTPSPGRTAIKGQKQVKVTRKERPGVSA